MTQYIPYIAAAALCLFVGYVAMDAIQTLSYDVQNVEGWGTRNHKEKLNDRR